LALWSQFGFDTGSFRLSVGSLGLTSADTLAMSNPHFEGMDDKKRPFSVTAARASQADSAADTIDLNAPQADMTLEDGAWLTLTADSGRYQRASQLLDLNGQVNLFHDKGYELHTRNVHIDLAKGRAVSNEAVDGQGPSGELNAQGMEVADGGKRILFLGRAHMTFYDEGQLSAAVPKP
jgi:lipopolysaccharide export system protein LptC